MKAPSLPTNESARLAALAELAILDTPAEDAFDGITELVAQILGVPIALVSLVDSDRQWFKARHGLAATETPRDISFCGHVVAEDNVLIVPDTLDDTRFADNPLVAGEPRIRFYIGLPLRTREGLVLGTLCAIDRVPRRLTAEQQTALRWLARQVTDQLELRHRRRAMLLAEARLEEATARLDAVLDVMFEGVVVQDATGAIIECNRSAEAILGLTEDQMRGLSSVDPRWKSIRADGSPFPGEEHPAMVALRTRVPQRQVLMGLEQGGPEPRWIEINAALLPAREGGDPVGVLSTFADVTATRRYATALAAERGFLETVLSNLPSTIVAVFDAEALIVRAFGDGREIGLQGPIAALVGRPLTEVISAMNASVVHAAVAGCLRGESNQFPVARRGRNFDVRLVPLQMPMADGARGLLVAHDVTEREAMRDRMERQQRLVTTGTLAAGVGHEINNPLQYVIGGLDFAVEELREIAGPSPAARMADVVRALVEAREGGDRIREIVRGLRAFAREEVASRAIDLAAAIRVAHNISKHELRHRARLELEIDPVAEVQGDEARVTQVLVNLLVNAAQAFETPDPERNCVRLRLRMVGDRVQVEVADNGPGMSPEVQARMFDPFFTTKPVGVGTGLGLSICHSIATSMGAELTYETEPGKGTTFRVTFAAATAAADPVPISATPASGPRRGRIAVVDDDTGVVRSIERLLRAEHDVVSYSDPRQAMAALLDPDIDFDLIFCDLMMPHVTGAELYRAVIRALPARAERFVFMSGGTVHSDVETLLGDVPNERLEKPFNVQNLRGMARRYVASNR